MFLVQWLFNKLCIRVSEPLDGYIAFRDLCFLCAVLLGNKVYGANLTLSIGAFSVQPAEFVKIFVCYVCCFDV